MFPPLLGLDTERGNLHDATINNKSRASKSVDKGPTTRLLASEKHKLSETTGAGREDKKAPRNQKDVESRRRRHLVCWQ